MLSKNFNEYLFYEMGFDTDFSEDQITENWPFTFSLFCTISYKTIQMNIYEFTDEEIHYLITDSPFSFMEKKSLTKNKLELFYIGSDWIGSNDPLGLEVAKIGYENIPDQNERRQCIKELINQKIGDQEYQLIEGLYMQKSKEYLAAIALNNQENLHLIGSRIYLRNIPLIDLPIHMRISIGIGQLVKDNRI
jgi:hypothetical protein